jgi:hypothetical protein
MGARRTDGVAGDPRRAVQLPPSTPSEPARPSLAGSPGRYLHSSRPASTATPPAQQRPAAPVHSSFPARSPASGPRRGPGEGRSRLRKLGLPDPAFHSLSALQQRWVERPNLSRRPTPDTRRGQTFRSASQPSQASSPTSHLRPARSSARIRFTGHPCSGASNRGRSAGEFQPELHSAWAGRVIVGPALSPPPPMTVVPSAVQGVGVRPFLAGDRCRSWRSPETGQLVAGHQR